MISCLLSNTRHLIHKLFDSTNCKKFHAISTECGAYIGQFERKDCSVKCKVCKTEISVKNNAYKVLFDTIDVSSLISKLIESNSESYNYIMNGRVYEDGVIRDICDRKGYRDFITSEPDRHRYVKIIFNTDSANLFDSSAYSIWPIFLMVNELRFNVRCKELILAGLWF